MIRLILLPLALLLVTGCGTLGFGKKEPPKTVIEYRDILVPVPKTPTPPNTDCPDTELETISPAEAMDDAQLAKAYRITVSQLWDCAALREKVIEKYRELAEDDQEAINDIPAAAGNPFSSAGPTADDGLPNDALREQLKAKQREKQIDNAFGDLEDEFDGLGKKDYSR